MATKDELKDYIKGRIKTNTNQEITGNGLQTVLCKMVDEMPESSTSEGVSQEYVDTQDQATLDAAKKYADGLSTEGGSGITWEVLSDLEDSAKIIEIVQKFLTQNQVSKTPFFVLLPNNVLVTIQGFDSGSIWGYAFNDHTTDRTSMYYQYVFLITTSGVGKVYKYPINLKDKVVVVGYKGGQVTYLLLKENHQEGKTSIVEFGDGVRILMSQADLSTFRGYGFNFNTGTTSEGTLGIVSTAITRYTFTSEGLTKDTFTVYSDGNGGGGSASLTWAYSDYAGEDTPADPDTNPSIWYATKTDASIWAALREEGGSWNIWRLKPYAGDPGESSLYVDLDNEIEAIGLDYEGNTPSSGGFTPTISAYYGLTQLTLDYLAAVVTGTQGVQVSADKSTGNIVVTWSKGVALTSFSVHITVKVTVKGTSYTRVAVFKVNCIKAGAPGEDAILYKIQPSVDSIFKYSDGTYSVDTISCKKLKVQGKKIEETQDGVLTVKIDNGTASTYTNPIACSSITKKVRFEYSVDNVLWDAEDVFLLEDGKTLSIVDTKYQYALTLNHVVPSEDSWTKAAHLEDSTPIEGLPGQYLWTRVIYTWSDGTVTYSLSYSRCGTDGQDGTGTSKATIANFHGTWKKDGLYTGMEDDTTIRVDIVYYAAAGEVDGKYYIAIATKQFVNEPTPAPGTEEGKAYWGAFQGQFANVATGLLFTEKAIIENAVIRELQTAGEGERIETSGNKLVVYNSRNKIVTQIDPDLDTSVNNSIELSKSSTKPSETTIWAINTLQAGTHIVSVNIATLSKGATFDESPYEVYGYIRNLIFRVNPPQNSSSNLRSMKLEITALMVNTSTQEEQVLATKTINLYSLDEGVSGFYYPDSIRAVSLGNGTEFSFRIRTKCTLTLSSGTSATLNFSIYASSGLEVGFASNRGVLIGNNGMSVGSELLHKYLKLNAFGEKVIEIESDSCGISVGDQLLVKDHYREYSPLLNPVNVQCIVTKVPTPWADADVNKLLSLSNEGVPVYVYGTLHDLNLSYRVLLNNIQADQWLGSGIFTAPDSSIYMITAGFSGSMAGGVFNSGDIINLDVTYKKLDVSNTALTNSLSALADRVTTLEERLDSLSNS